MIAPPSRIVPRAAICALIVLGPLLSRTEAVSRDPAPENSIQSAGAPLDVSAWRFRKTVTVPNDGVQQLELDLDVLSHAAPSLSDVRLVQDNRQIPYIIEDKPIRRSLNPTLRQSGDQRRSRISLWTISLPHRGAPVVSVTLTSATPYFKRSVRLYERRDDTGGDFTFASTTWTRAPEGAEGQLAILLPRRPKGQELILEIDNGDNPPLDLREPTATYAAMRIVFNAPPATNIFLYYGNEKSAAPKYDLELITPRLLYARKSEAILGSEERLRADPIAVRVQGSMKTIFWICLGAVVVGLLFAILFLLPKSKPSQQPQPPKPEPPPAQPQEAP
jgi:hypothetical protein